MPDPRSEIAPVDIHVGQRLRHYRTLAGMSQAALAKAIGLSTQQVRKYEVAKARITANKLFHAARTLGVPVADFFMDVDATPDPPTDGKLLQLISTFLKSEEGQELATVFPQIASKSVRRQIVSLARAVSGQNFSASTLEM